MSELDFELEIRPRAGLEYEVEVIRSPAGEGRTVMRFPFDELALQLRLKSLEIALLRSGGSRRRLSSPEEETVQDFGRDLFEALISGEVRSRFDVSRSEAMRQGKALRIKLRFEAPAMAALPWEFLYDERKGEYIALSTYTPLIRHVELPELVEPLTISPPLRVLGVLASPSDLPTLDTTREQMRVEEATRGLKEQGLIEVSWLVNPTWRDIQQALRRDTWHVFHFVGHGGFDRNADEGVVAIVDDDGATFRLPAIELARLLGDHRTMRLALLNACEGARSSAIDLFSSTAAAVVRRGTPAVVAMQYEITDRAAIEFSRSFYEAVADGMPVDMAVAEARKSMSVAVNNSLEWGTPVLFMRSSDGVLFRMRRRPARKSVGAVAGASATAAAAAAEAPAAVEPAAAERPAAVEPAAVTPIAVEPVPAEPATVAKAPGAAFVIEPAASIEPATADAEPAIVEPEPAQVVEPRMPVAALPTADAKPIVVEPEPVVVEAERALAEPEPVPADLEPRTDEPESLGSAEQATTHREPLAAEPERLPLERSDSAASSPDEPGLAALLASPIQPAAPASTASSSAAAAVPGTGAVTSAGRPSGLSARQKLLAGIVVAAIVLLGGLGWFNLNRPTGSGQPAAGTVDCSIGWIPAESGIGGLGHANVEGSGTVDVDQSADYDLDQCPPDPEGGPDVGFENGALVPRDTTLIVVEASVAGVATCKDELSSDSVSGAASVDIPSSEPVAVCVRTRAGGLSAVLLQASSTTEGSGGRPVAVRYTTWPNIFP